MKTYQFISQYNSESGEWAVSKELIVKELTDDQLSELGYEGDKDYVHIFVPSKKSIAVIFKDENKANIYKDAFSYGISAGNQPLEVYEYYLNKFLDHYQTGD